MITYGSITLTSYNSIVTTIIYYYQSISPTDLIGGTWSTTKPEWEEGTYVWQKLRTIYEDGTFSEGDAVNITGQQGKSGEAASSYKLTSSESAIALLKTGEYSTNQITFSATYKQGNNPIAPYNGGFIIQHSINGTEWVTDYTSLNDESSKTYTVPENILIIKCLLYQTKDCDELLDIITVPIIKDGIDGTGVTNSFPIYLVSDKDKGITLDDHGWTRFKPSLDAENKYLWIDYISRYAEGNIKPQLIEKTGNKITFEYHGERSPFESVIVDITPIQSGSGTPSSGNKRHISGWTSIDIGQADINLMPYEEGKYMLDLPEDIGTLDNQTLNLENTMFTIQGDTLIIIKGDLGTHITFPEEVGTVYGGKYNVTTGVLMVTHGYIDKYNNEPLPSTWISDRDVYVKGTKPSVGAQVVFELNEPLIYELMPQEIMIFEHSNSIYASTGDISISYYDYQTTTSPYIDYALVSAFDASTAANNKVTSVYGTCNTTAGTTVKVVVCPNFILFEGARIQVTFTNANTANAPTLNINNTGAKPIYINKTVTSSSNLLLWTAGSKMEFVYDGTGWIAQNVPYALYGTCFTGASTAAKAVTCNEAVICKGTTISVNMTNTNTAANATMNVGSTVAKDIYANDAKLTTNSRFNWRANTVQKFVFDGQVWRMDDDSVKALATAYITEIDNDGIMVHPENDTTSGWSIANAIELFKSGISYIKLWIDNNIPKIRIGKEDQGHLILDNDSIDIMENANDNLASFGKETSIGGENSSRLVLSPNEIAGQYKDGNESFHIYNYYTTKTGEKDIAENQKIFPDNQSNNGNTFRYALQNAPIINPEGTINIIVIGYNNNKEEIASGSQTLEYKYYYDSSNNPIRLTVNGEVFEEWTYDENGILIGVDEYYSAIEGISYDVSGNRPKTGDIFDIRYELFSGRYVVVTTSSNITSINLQVNYTTQAEIQIPNPYYTFGSRLGISQGSYSFAVGKNNIASAEYSVALGIGCKADADYSYAEGWYTTASGKYSRAEGNRTTASGECSHTEGYRTTASNDYSHSEGNHTTASGDSSHAEGWYATASGSCSHAEGYHTTASGNLSHAEGWYATASGNYSHASGNHTIASSDSQFVIGKYNNEDTYNKYSFIIGNGTADDDHSNALATTWDGNVELALDTAASSGTTDADLYNAITALGWGNDVLI